MVSGLDGFITIGVLESHLVWARDANVRHLERGTVARKRRDTSILEVTVLAGFLHVNGEVPSLQYELSDDLL